MCVFMEFNFNQPLEGGDQSGVSLFATPRVAYLTERYQVSVGMQVPLNHTAGKNEQMALLGSLIISMDKLNPRFSWLPF
jgi:hypothetical protein